MERFAYESDGCASGGLRSDARSRETATPRDSGNSFPGSGNGASRAAAGTAASGDSRDSDRFLWPWGGIMGAI